MTTIDFKKEYFVTELLKFIKQHFNHFEHIIRRGTNTWLTPSWAPFIEACFIRLGNDNDLEVGFSCNQPQLQNFWERCFPEPYNKPINRGFDVSWHDTEFEFVLGLEHEETEKTKRLQFIFEELIKLRCYKGKNKILITRPYFNGQQNYSDVENNYRIRIEEKIKALKPNDDETWIIILIGLDDPVDSQTNEILFSCYIWDKNNNNFLKFSNPKIPIKLEENQLRLR